MKRLIIQAAQYMCENQSLLVRLSVFFHYIIRSNAVSFPTDTIRVRMWKNIKEQMTLKKNLIHYNLT